MQWWTLTVIAAATLGLVLVNMMLFAQVRNRQLEVNGRQQFIQQGLQAEGLHRELVNSLASLALRHDDAQLRDLLTAHGITVTTNPTGGVAGTAETGKSPRRP